MRRIAFVLVICFALSPISLAQEDTRDLLSEKLDQVMVLLQELVDAQRAELALRALQVKAASVERLEAREGKLKDRLAAARVQRQEVAAELDLLEDQLTKLKPGGAFEATALQNRAKLESRLEILEGSIASTEAELSEVEIALLDAEQGLLTLEEKVDAGLEGL